MAESTTIARPYARAAFETAQAGKKKGLALWSDMLGLASAIAADAAMQRLLASPALDQRQKAELLIELCGDTLDPAGSNFIRLLADNHRLSLLPAIAQVYEQLRSDAEKTVEAEIIAAFEVSDEQRDKLAKVLRKRLGRDVTLSCRVDESLIGGAIIRAGDLVIDGSARSKLGKLASALRQ